MYFLRKFRHLKTCLLLGLLLQTPLLVAAEANRAITEQAQEFYLKKEFKKAADLGTQVPQLEALSPDLFALIAQSQYRLQKEGDAALWYQRLLLLEPTHPEARQNLSYLQRKHGSVGSVRLQTPVSAWIQQHASTLVLSASLLLWGSILSFAIKSLYFQKRKSTPLLITFNIVSTSLAIAIGAAVFFLQPRKDTTALAIVTEPGAVAFAGASTTSGRIIQLPQASEVRILEERGSWTYVEIQPQEEEAKRGWVKTDYLKKLWPYKAEFLPSLI